MVYTIGYSGVSIMGHVLIADMTSKVNRGLIQAVYDVPAIINIFVAPIAGQHLVELGIWRMAYGMISICLAGTAVFLFAGLFSAEYKIRRNGQLKEVKEQLKEQTPARSLLEKIQWVSNEIDLVGSLLMIGWLCMLLLPLILATTDFGGWNTSKTIGLLVGGAVTLVVFFVYERFGAPQAIIPVGKWKDWTPIAGVLTISIISIISSINWQYYQMYLQVSRRWTIIKATHFDRSYDAVYLVSQVVAGILMKRFKVYRPIVLVGIALFLLGMGLMIPARFPDSSDVFVAATQVISGWGAGWCFVPTLVAVQSAVPHQGNECAPTLKTYWLTLITSFW